MMKNKFSSMTDGGTESIDRLLTEAFAAQAEQLDVKPQCIYQQVNVRINTRVVSKSAFQSMKLPSILGAAAVLALMLIGHVWLSPQPSHTVPLSSQEFEIMSQWLNDEVLSPSVASDEEKISLFDVWFDDV